jgi:hypothetical protein
MGRCAEYIQEMAQMVAPGSMVERTVVGFLSKNKYLAGDTLALDDGLYWAWQSTIACVSICHLNLDIEMRNEAGASSSIGP